MIPRRHLEFLVMYLSTQEPHCRGFKPRPFKAATELACLLNVFIPARSNLITAAWTDQCFKVDVLRNIVRGLRGAQDVFPALCTSNGSPQSPWRQVATLSPLALNTMWASAGI